VVFRRPKPRPASPSGFPSLFSSFLSLVLWVTPGAAFAQSPLIHFFQEEIDVQILGDSCILAGTYHFRNGTGDAVAKELLYPFPRRKDLAPPTTIEARDLATGARVPIQRVPRGALFTVLLPPRGEVAYRIRFVQPTPAHRMEYLLTSTRQWGKPLERAAYSIVIPRDYRLTSLSFPADTSWDSVDSRTYFFRRVNFMPTTNLILTWQPRELR
jgi:hypothetical protein